MLTRWSLNKEKAQRERIMYEYAKTVARNLELKYSSGSPLMRFYDIVDDYDRTMLTPSPILAK